MNEYTRAARWLATALAGLPGTPKVYEAPAPQDATYPCVTFEQHDEADVAVIGAHRVWARFLFLVTAVDKGLSTSALEPVADAIDAALHRTDGTTSDGRVISSTRDDIFHDRPIEEGITYVRLGGTYELLVQPLNP